MLKVDYAKFFTIVGKRFGTVAWISALRIIILPVIVRFLAQILRPTYAIGFFILAAAPTAFSTIFFVDFVKGNKELGLATSVFSNLIVPFTFTALTYYLVGSEIQLNVGALFGELLLVVAVPFILGYIIQKTAPTFIKATQHLYSPIGILLILPMIAGPVAALHSYIVLQGIREILLLVLALFVLGAFFYAFGWFGSFQKSLEDKATAGLSVGLMNVSFATVIAFNFFGPAAILAVILYEFPRDLLIIPYIRIVKKIKK